MPELPVVCVPRLGVGSLLTLRATRLRPSVVLFDMTPRYAKALVRWLRVPERFVLAGYSAMAGAPVRRAAPAGSSRGAAPINVAGMKAVSRIILGLSGELERQGWTRVLGSAIGEREAAAYFHRRFPGHEVWPRVLAVALAVNAVDGEKVLVLWGPWPSAWERVAETELRKSFDVEFVAWPRGLRRTGDWASKAWWAVRAMGTIIGRLLRQGVGAAAPRTALAAIEWIDPARFGGGPSDTNFVEDGERIRRGDVLYFLTSDQARVLRRQHGKPGEALRATRDQGFQVVDLRRAKYSPRSARLALGTAVSLLRTTPRLGPGCSAHAFWQGIADVMNHLLLFDVCRPRNVLHTQSPNGHTGGRFDSAVVTGLAHRRGSRTVGYQNRCTYDSVYEDAFDCYDIYLAWGNRWREILPDDNRFIDRVIQVGCVNNDGWPALPPPARDRPIVAVFTTELEGTLFAGRAVVNLLRTCIELARSHPHCRFRVKTKDPHNIDQLLADTDLRAACESVAGNFEFLSLARHETVDVIVESDIVIASAWTTPGSDALLLGRRVLFYNEMGAGGKPFGDLPDMVASSPAELTQLFMLALDDYHEYFVLHRPEIARLDPFLDGRSRVRIVDELLADG